MRREEIDYRIRINSLELENYRLFSNLQPIEFDRQLTVLIGENGSGKSAILDALAELLKSLLKKTFYPKQRNSLTILNSDIKNGMENSSATLMADVLFPIESWEDQEEDENIIEWVEGESKIAIEFSAAKTNYGKDSQSQFRINEFDYFKESIADRTITDNLPILLYYGASKANIKDIEKSSRKNIARESMIYQNALSPESFSFQQFYDWFDTLYKIKMQQDLIALQKEKEEFSSSRSSSSKRKSKSSESVIIDVINEVITSFLNEKGKTMYSTLRMEYRTEGGVLVMDKNQVPIEVNQLSSGEKSIVALLADILRRLYFANERREDLLEGNGIILIDEVGIHLHPKWQRKIVPFLVETFPNVQFVITTHSPEVLMGIDREKLRIIKNGKILKAVPFIEGRDTTSILEDAFDLPERPLEYKQKISKLYEAIEKNKNQAKEIIEELKQKWGEMDEEILRAESYLEIF